MPNLRRVACLAMLAASAVTAGALASTPPVHHAPAAAAHPVAQYTFKPIPQPTCGPPVNVVNAVQRLLHLPSRPDHACPV